MVRSSISQPSDGFASAQPSRSFLSRPGAADHSAINRVSSASAAESGCSEASMNFSMAVSSPMPSGSPTARCATRRRCFRTTERTSPALDRAMMSACERAIVDLVTAPHASQSFCSRSSSNRIRSPEKPRPAPREAALTFQRRRPLRTSERLPLMATILAICAASHGRSGCSSPSSSSSAAVHSSVARSRISSAVSKSCAAPSTVDHCRMYSANRPSTSEMVDLPFWRATSSSSVL